MALAGPAATRTISQDEASVLPGGRFRLLAAGSELGVKLGPQGWARGTGVLSPCQIDGQQQEPDTEYQPVPPIGCLCVVEYR